jgi:hypothetical protein
MSIHYADLHTTEGSARDFDTEFELCVNEILTRFERRLNKNKIERIRVEQVIYYTQTHWQWLAKLKEPASNETWKKNRNLYIQSLLIQLESKVSQLEPPFDKLPPEGPLQKLPSWMNSFLSDTSSQMRLISPTDSRQVMKETVIFEMRQPKDYRKNNAVSPTIIRDDFHILEEIPQKIYRNKQMEDKIYIEHMESQLLEERSRRLVMERQLRDENHRLLQKITRLEQDLEYAHETINKLQKGEDFKTAARSDMEFLDYLTKFEAACTNLLKE